LTGIMSTNILLGILNASSMLLTIVYSILLFGRVCLGNTNTWMQPLLRDNCIIEHKGVKSVSLFSKYDLHPYEFNILTILLLLSLFFGIYPQPLINCLSTYVSSLIELNIFL
jgi:NADH:ubiquinone oxidoreductase subunit 4 (subunit M)